MNIVNIYCKKCMDEDLEGILSVHDGRYYVYHKGRYITIEAYDKIKYPNKIWSRGKSGMVGWMMNSMAKHDKYKDKLGDVIYEHS